MARHPTARRVHDRGAADPDDAFIAQFLELVAWAKARARVLFISGLVLAVGIAAGLYYRNFQNTVRAKSEAELGTVLQTLASGNAALAIRDLEAFVTRFDGTRAADEARLLLAQTYLAEGQPQNAIATVDPLARSLGKGTGTTAALLKASALEADGRADQAETLYLDIGQKARFSYERQDALDAAARIRMERGDAAGAIELYERLVQMAPEGSPDRGVFELRLAEARALNG